MRAEGLTESKWEMVAGKAHADVMKLRMRYHNDAAMAAVINQIDCRQHCSKKLGETLARAPRFYFPSRLSAEQSTSDSLARYHASLLPPQSSVLDMTCGLGIDAFHFASKSKRVVAYDINQATAAATQHNAKLLGLDNVTVICGDSVKALEGMKDDDFDVIFIDPARRGDHGKRLFALADCEPDVTKLLPRMLEVAPRVMIKASPMLDISHTIAELENLETVYAIGTTRECKELVISCRRGYTAVPKIHATTILSDGDVSEFQFSGAEEKEAVAEFTAPEPGQILLDPYPAVLKTGPFNLLAQRFGLHKVAPNSHLYFSNIDEKRFPGSRFAIDSVMSLNNKTAKIIAGMEDRFDVSTRNSPLTAEALIKKLKIKTGGERRLFATSLAGRQAIVIIASPLKG
ncbi:MAG: class I SAM-dependent methyltransferase [Firmicutes bacterium]|nr:class I SAM-dependent methyltransferase [Bacillota bacterium]